MVHYTADLLHLKPYSEQAKQEEAECLAEEHAASGIEPGTTTLSANTQRIDSPHKLHAHEKWKGGFERLFDFFLAHDHDLKIFWIKVYKVKRDAISGERAVELIVINLCDLLDDEADADKSAHK